MSTRGILLLLSLLLVFVVFIGGELFYLLFYTFLLSLIIPFIHSLITVMGLNVEISTPNKVFFKDSEITVNYKVQNRTPFLIPYLIIENKLKHNINSKKSQIVRSLLGKEIYNYYTTINLPKRGYYSIGEFDVTVQDIFKIFKFKKKISSDEYFLVYPKVIHLSSLKNNFISYEGAVPSPYGNSEDTSSVNTIREYVEGDKIKSIHWKLAAKNSQPMVKVFDDIGSLKEFIFIDNSILSYKQDIDERLEDKAVEVAVSIIDYFLNNGIDFTLFYQDEDSTVEIHSKEIDDLKIVLDSLAKLKANGKKMFQDLLLNNMVDISEYSNVVIITPNFNKEVGTAAIDLLNKNASATFILVEDKKNNTGFYDVNILQNLVKENVSIYPVDYNADIKDILEHRYE